MNYTEFIRAVEKSAQNTLHSECPLTAVSYAYTLGSHKGTFILKDRPGIYIEATYNRRTNELYADYYRKEINICYSVNDDNTTSIRSCSITDTPPVQQYSENACIPSMDAHHTEEPVKE